MFDIGFWEIILISVVGLIVLGPERLPVAIRSVMRWVNTAKSMANSVRAEISQEIKLHEINISKTAEQKVATIVPELKQSLDEMKDEIKNTVKFPEKDSTSQAQQDKTDDWR